MKPSQAEYPLPSPQALGLDKPGWRVGQDRALWDLLNCDKRFFALVQPVGSGKSITYTAYSILQGGRWLFLTATRSLQTQIMRDLEKLRTWIDVRGQSNYVCLADEPRPVSEGMCHAGVQCDLRASGCTYYDRVRQAANFNVVTNYSWWLHNGAYGQSIGEFDGMVLDEAHHAPDELSAFLGVYVSEWELQNLARAGRVPTSSTWQEWARDVREQLTRRVDSTHVSALDRRGAELLTRVKDLLRRITRLAMIESPSAWTFERSGKGWRWDPISPAEFAESYLYRKIPRVVFVSATIRQKTLDLMGVPQDEREFREYPSTFPPERRPIIHVPTVRVDYRTGGAALKLWRRRLDQIIAARQDRNGIVHSVSYDRKSDLYGQSRYRRFMLKNNDSASTTATVEAFKRRRFKPPAILISPSVTTGLDFPYEECEYIVIPKVPFQPTTSAIMRARMKLDPEYPMYLTAQILQQSVGRGDRAPDDRCETLITDDHFKWFVSRYRKFFAAWFLEAVRWARTLPAPPPKLRRLKSGRYA